MSSERPWRATSIGYDVGAFSDDPEVRTQQDALIALGLLYGMTGTLNMAEMALRVGAAVAGDRYPHPGAGPGQQGLGVDAELGHLADAGEPDTMELRQDADVLAAFDAMLQTRRQEADEFYASVIPPSLDADAALVMRQALAGMLWSKQFYYFDVNRWLEERGSGPFLPLYVDPPAIPADDSGCMLGGC